MSSFSKNQSVKSFIIVFILFLLGLFLSIMLVDSVIFPSITADRKIVNVPSIQDKSIAEARRLLSSANLNIEITKEIYSEKYKTGKIVSQMPVASSKVKSGRAIFVTVSKGKELVAVPYLQGLQMRNAKISLLKNGLDLGNISYDFNENIPKDAIISQSRQAGTKIPYGERINIVISKGSKNQMKVPNLVGMTLSEAIATIKETGLLLGIIDRKIDETYLPDIVISQSPFAGEMVVGEAAVNITITK